MVRRKEPTDEDILKARKVISDFGKTALGDMSREYQEKLVERYYLNIRGVPISELPDNQLYHIAEGRYQNALRLYELPLSFEGENPQSEVSQTEESSDSLESQLNMF